MNFQLTSKEEEADLRKRTELQAKLQEAIRRSAPSGELNRIRAELEAVNRRLEAYPSRQRRIVKS